MSLRLWITADDYGLAQGVNKAIERLAAEGKLSGASVMCHRDAQLESLSCLRNTAVATGLHVVLVEERPLLPESRFGPLLDERGRLPRNYRRLFAQVLQRPGTISALRDESHAQLDRFLGLGLPFDFINSHQHTHLFPPIWLGLSSVFRRAEQLGAAVRLSGRAVPRRGGRDIMVALASQASRVLRRTQARRIHQPIGLAFSGRLAISHLAAVLDEVSQRRSLWREDLVPELVTHPGIPDATCEPYRHWNYQWGEEFELLRSPELLRFLSHHRIDLERRSPCEARRFP